MQRRLGLTAVMVTHDQDEAMSMADRMAVMRAGRLEQVDAPTVVYDAPANRFVASFVGASVEMPGRVVELQGDRCAVALDAGARLEVVLGRTGGIGRNSRVVVSARPEHLSLYDDPAPDRLAADLRQSAPIAGMTVHDLCAGELEMKVIEPRLAALRSPGPVYVGLAASARPALFAFNETVPGDHA